MESEPEQVQWVRRKWHVSQPAAVLICDMRRFFAMYLWKVSFAFGQSGFGWCLKESEEEIQEEMEEWWHFESPWWGCFSAFDQTRMQTQTDCSEAC